MVRRAKSEPDASDLKLMELVITGTLVSEAGKLLGYGEQYVPTKIKRLKKVMGAKTLYQLAYILIAGGYIGTGRKNYDWKGEKPLNDELQLIHLLIEGHSIKTAAKVMGIPNSTGMAIERRARRRTRTRNISQLIAICYRQGFLYDEGVEIKLGSLQESNSRPAGLSSLQ